MNFKLKAKKGELHVTATIPPALKGTQPGTIQTPEVLDWIKKNHPSYKIEEVKSGGIAHNAGHRAERTCTWVFSLETPPKEKAPEQAPKVKAPEQTPKVKAALTRPRPKGKSSSRTTRTNEG